nr:type IIL restriction-modification enzyme MmeI [Rhodoferax sp.]
MIRELGEDYTFALRKVYEGRVPGGADLVCYWFEKARTAIETNGLGAAGLVSTNSIRGGANRRVLEAICRVSRIYEAWSDEGWVNEGAAVRVSLVAFGHATQAAQLDGVGVDAIAADLSPQKSGDSTDLTTATKLTQNANASFIGTQKNGPFDVSREQAAHWLLRPNPHGKSNALVIRPWANGLDVTRRPQNRWVVDFGCDTPLANAVLFELPFAYVQLHVKPTRANVRRDFHRNNWWLYGDARPGLRKALAAVSRFIVTPMVAKHRVLAWMPAMQIPENLCVAITRADDTTFGILHSRFHELWSLRMCTWLGVGNDPRYTPTTCFETFPFPAGLTPADTAHQRTETLPGGAVIPADLSEENGPLALVNTTQSAIKCRANAIAIAQAAKRLNDLREAWLNPPEWTDRVPEVIPLGMTTSPYPDRILPKLGHEKDLAERTLTKLYNQRPAWLDAAHKALDLAVAHTYGWSDYTADMPDEEILKRLLALNLELAGRA